MTKESKEPEFISPLYDTTFKHLWKKETSKAYLTRLVFLLTKINLEEFSLYDPEINSGNSLKDHRMDIVFVKDPKEPRKSDMINVEMYKTYDNASVLKSKYYAYKLLGESMTSGDRYFKRNLIQINLNNGKFEENKKEKILIFKIMSTEGKYQYDDITMYNVYLSNFKDTCYTESEELARMLSFLAADSYEEMEKIANKDKEMLRVMEELKELAINEKFIGLYNFEREHQRMMNTERDLGKEEGLQEGMVLGEEKGLQEGKLLGKEEQNIEIAKNMLKNKIDIKMISSCTGLSIEEIENLK